jgi:hypothetical protein
LYGSATIIERVPALGVETEKGNFEIRKKTFKR